MFDRIRILLGPHEGPIGRLLRDSPPAAFPAAPDPPGGASPPGIGNRMRREHAALLEAFRTVLDSHWRRDYVGCLAHLRRFEHKLDEYLANDEALHEAYLAAPPDGDCERFETLRALRARLRHVARQARQFAALRPTELHAPGGLDSGLAFLAMAKTLRDCLEGQMARMLPLYQARSHERGREARAGSAA